ncbi:hypothetical protein PHLCEN_2v11958 [Hermanssonia centrifuga]|uniref:ABM domain-containing protein n=1 Tax=Hermanssonia centrifuga TaxID=98765 RepID=A0A2R6NIF7_9APHY|nr:hypothetical protein PHLCEN_2v11958 [Hermanssonia centrifuga]
MASPEYSELQAKVTPSATILESMKHVTFNTEPYTALNSPLAEFAIWTLYESTDKQKFQEKLEKLVDLVINLPPPAKVYKGGWGPVVENDRQFVVLLGWESLESFNSNIAASPQEVRDLIAELKGLADLDLKHVSLHLGPQN